MEELTRRLRLFLTDLGCDSNGETGKEETARETTGQKRQRVSAFRQQTQDL